MSRPVRQTVALAWGSLVSLPALILVAEDDDLTRELLVTVLARDGHRVVEAESGVEALEQLKRERFDLVLSDIQMARVGGMEVLSHVTAHCPLTAVVLITAYAEPGAAMDAISQGAADYLAKPVDVFALRATVSRALERRRLTQENVRLRGEKSAAKALVGTSPAMLQLYKQIAQVAPTHVTVLLVGESGAGKELIARTVHDRSRRAGRPYVAVNCAALAEGVLESELFGHERGAFTGAHGTRLGVFEEASGGTLFLDEIGDVPPKMQAQLLRALQEGEVRRVGGSAPIAVDVRVIGATNRDLTRDVAEGRMREDLYYRLNVVTLKVPSLRERGDDVVELARYFVSRHAASFGRPVPELSAELLDCLRAHPWPGNVRELENALARAVAMSKSGVLMAEDLPPLVAPTLGRAAASIDADWPTMEELERRYIERVLSKTDGNKSMAANILGLDRRTLQRLQAQQALEKRE